MKNKKSNSNIAKNLLSTLIVIVLITATVAIGFFSSGFRNWTKEDWENVWDETFEDSMPEQDGESVTDENGNELEESAISLNMSSSDGSVTITATITPSTALNKKVDWSLAWKNASSSWANGKTVTDYVTITPSSDGSTTATVTCLQPFGEQISIKVTSRANENAFATCNVDYVKRIKSTGLSVTGDYSLQDGILNFGEFEDRLDKIIPSIDINHISVWGDGTIEKDDFISGYKYYIKASDELKSLYPTAVSEYVELTSLGQVNLLETVFDETIYLYHKSHTSTTVTGEMITYPAYYTLETSTFNEAMTALGSLDGHAFELKIVAETLKGNVESVINITVSKSNLNLVAEKIVLNNTDIEF